MNDNAVLALAAGGVAVAVVAASQIGLPPTRRASGGGVEWNDPRYMDKVARGLGWSAHVEETGGGVYAIVAPLQGGAEMLANYDTYWTASLNNADGGWLSDLGLYGSGPKAGASPASVSVWLSRQRAKALRILDRT